MPNLFFKLLLWTILLLGELFNLLKSQWKLQVENLISLVIVNPFFFSNCEGFHLSNEGFFSWLPLLVLVSFGCSFKFLGFQKKLSFESGDYFPSVIVLVIILCQFFCNFVQLKQYEICIPCCGDSNCSTCKWKLQTTMLPWQVGGFTPFLM